jgi:hypothetical protein
MHAIKTLAAALTLAGVATAASAAGTLVFSPVDSDAAVGETVVVEVRGQGFSDFVVGGGFDLAFDPAVLSLSSVQIDTAEWEFITNPGTIDNSAGTLTAVWFNAFADPLPTGSFPIATLRFDAVAPGTATLNLLANAGFPFVSDLVELIDVDFSQQGTVSVVPEPATWAHFALGLALLPWLRRRLAAQGLSGAQA